MKVITKNQDNTKLDSAIREKIIKAIKQVYDPELGVDVYELGFIYELHIIPPFIHIIMTLTTPNCPVIESLPREVQEKVAQTLGNNYQVTLQLTFDPPYSVNRMSEEAKFTLNQY